ncbi:MAG: hypothetical protein J2P15_02505 [Micromonosporaceae bacterium]|nr:hypothetical protein [Micromonosporaceae bacterium]
MAGTDDVTTPPELAGQAYESAVRSKAAQLKEKLINQTLKDVDSFKDAVWSQWAADHPGLDPSSSAEPNSTDIQRYMDTVRNDYYEWVVPAFERYLTPDPDAANAMIDTLNAIQNNFGGTADGTGNFTPSHPGLVRIGDALNDLTYWVGALQENFIDNFLSPLQNVALNEGTVAQVARELLLLNKINYIRHRNAVLKLLDASATALDNLVTKNPKPALWATLIVTSIGTVLTAGTAGTVLVLGTTLSIAGTLGQGLVPNQPVERQTDLSAPTAQEVAVNIADAIGRLDSDTEANDVRLVEGFKQAYDLISHLRSSYIASNTSGPLNVARPGLDSARPASIVGAAFRPSDY